MPPLPYVPVTISGEAKKGWGAGTESVGDGCVRVDGVDRGRMTKVSCTDGSKFTGYDDSYWAVLGGEIKYSLASSRAAGSISPTTSAAVPIDRPNDGRPPSPEARRRTYVWGS